MGDEEGGGSVSDDVVEVEDLRPPNASQTPIADVN